jgi:putative DNA primase/helicase
MNKFEEFPDAPAELALQAKNAVAAILRSMPSALVRVFDRRLELFREKALELRAHAAHVDAEQTKKRLIEIATVNGLCRNPADSAAVQQICSEAVSAPIVIKEIKAEVKAQQRLSLVGRGKRDAKLAPVLKGKTRTEFTGMKRTSKARAILKAAADKPGVETREAVVEDHPAAAPVATIEPVVPDEPPAINEIPDGANEERANKFDVKDYVEVATRRRAETTGRPSAKSRDESLAYSDEVLAQNFIDKHIADLRYTALWGQWLIWDGRRWAPDDKLATFSFVRQLCYEQARQAESRDAKNIASAGTVAAIERLARADQRIAVIVNEWDADPWLLNTPSGTVNLQTNEMRKHNPDDKLTKVTGVAPDADCPIPLWTRFLATVTDGNNELIACLQRMAGYSLTGLTREHALFFLHGTGANGKTTFLNAITACAGEYHRVAPIETFTASNNERHPTELAGLRGARLVTAVETEEGRRWDESKIKALTGGDTISARFMRQDFFQYMPQFKLIIAGNHKPGLRSVDEAIRRRFNLIPFTVTIPPADRDPEFPEKLKIELPGILAWMIEGCRAWQQQGLAPPQVVTDATAAYLESEDAISAWIDECCQRDQNSFATSTHLFVSWNQWATKNGEYAGTTKKLVSTLESKGFQPLRKNSARGFVGLRVLPDYEQR